MQTVATILRMVARRSLAHWRLLTATAAGVIFASALMAAVFIYSDAVRNLGLTYALRDQPPLSLDINVSEASMPFAGSDFAKPYATANSLIQRQVGDIRTSIVHIGQSATFFPATPGQPYPSAQDRPRANLLFADDLSQHVRLVSGSQPAPYRPPPSGQAPSLDVIVGAQAAKTAGLHVGQSFDLYPYWRQVKPIHVTVSGFVQPIDPSSPYWFGGATDLFSSTTSGWVTIPMFTTQQAVVEGVGGYLPDLEGNLSTYVYVDPGRITHANAASLAGRVNALSSLLQTQLPYATVQTHLANVIQSYQSHLFFARLPLFAFMIQVVGIVLFYLVVVSAMTVEHSTGEIALLRSRGASLREVMAIYLIETGTIALVATIVGPFLAAGIISLLGLTPPFHALSDGHLLSAPLSGAAFGMAAAGALCALAAMLWPAYRAARVTIVGYKQQASRPRQQPFFLRYYLDVGLLVVAALILYELHQHNALFTQSIFGGPSSDPLLLAAPTIFMIIVALIVLRLFPLALKATLRLARVVGGATVTMGLTRMARSPLEHSRLILLLILTTAVGMFAAGFRATLERSYHDQASYEAGAAVRISGINQPSNITAPQLTKAIEQATGSNEVVPVIRADGYYNTSQFNSTAVTLLGVPPAQFAQVAYWRSDFAPESLSALLHHIPSPPVVAVAPPAVPSSSRYIGVWIRPAAGSPRLSFGIELIDADGAPWDYVLRPVTGAAEPGSWQFYAADLSRPTFNHPATSPVAAEREWTVGSLFIETPPLAPLQAIPVTVLFSDVQASPAPPGSNGFARPATVERFSHIQNFEPIRGEGPGGDLGALSAVPAPAPREGLAARFVFDFARGNPSTVGLRFNRGAQLVPILASAAFLNSTGKHIGDVITLYVSGRYVQARVAASFTYFPTFDPANDYPLLVANLNALAAQDVPGASGLYPTEVWLGGVGGAPTTLSTLAAHGVRADVLASRSAILAKNMADPLIAAGWEGILFLAFAAVLIVSAAAFVAYCALGAHARSLEFAILRTIGFSGRQVLGIVGFEQAFVILTGLVAGTLLGFPLGRLMTGYLALSGEGKSPLPPLVAVVNWTAIGVVYAALLILVIVTITALVAVYTRLAISRALRIGEL